LLGCFYEQHSVRAKEKAYKKKLERGFQQIHCREQRVFEANDSGFTTQCKCGMVTRPWSKLTSFSESKTHFALKTKMDGQVLPKSAFSSEADVTRFRELASGQLNQDKPATAPHFDFALKAADLRAAYWLHTLKGGGWRGLVKALVIYASMIYVVRVLWTAAPSDGLRAGVIGGLVGLLLLRMIGKRRQHYFGPLAYVL